MMRYATLLLIILLETFQNVYCGNDSYDPFSPNISKKTDLKNDDLSEDKEIMFENDGGHSEEKIIEKRRLLFKEAEVNSPVNAEEFENDYSPRRRTNYSETESENQMAEYQNGYNWENKQNRFSISTESGNARNLPEFRLGQPLSNQNLNWGQMSDIFEIRQSNWNEEKNFKQGANAESEPVNPNSRIGNNYNGRFQQVINDNYESRNFHPGRNGEAFNRRVSMTAVNGAGLLKAKNYDFDRLGDLHSGYLRHSDMNHYDGNRKSFWNPNYYSPEKGVVINFNTECPTPRPLSNQMVHKFVFTPKSSMSGQVENLPYEILGSATTPKITPMYYSMAL